MIHDLTLAKAADDWDVAACSCGWASPPAPSVEISASFWGDHRALVAVAEVAR